MTKLDSALHNGGGILFVFDTKKREAPSRAPEKKHTPQNKASPYDGLMQMASMMGNSAMEAYLQQDLAPKSNVLASESGGRELPPSLRERFEAKSGVSFDDVRVHYNSDKPAQLQALAYTQGNDVHIAAGQERHLEHELGHVAQQKQGRVKPTTEVGGVAVNDDARLEREADGTVQMKSGNGVSVTGDAVQMFVITNADVHIVLDTETTGDTATTLNVHYKYGKISCKQYTNQTQRITSGEFTGCLMAIFRCANNIGGIVSGNDYVAHVANDGNVSYSIGGTLKTGCGKELLKDLAENDYISNLQYFRPSYKKQNDQNYNRTLRHIVNLKNAGTYAMSRESETGIIELNNGMVTSVAHKFDNVTQDETNPKITANLTQYNDDRQQNLSVLQGNSGYNESVLQCLLTIACAMSASMEVINNLMDKIEKDSVPLNENTIKFITTNRNTIQNFNSTIEKQVTAFIDSIQPQSAPKSCYLTTTCVEHKNLSDDCEELTVLRNFRDTYLKNQKNGQQLINEYYQTAPQIVEAINNDPEKESVLDDLYEIIKNCVQAIKNNDNEYAFQAYCDMVHDLKQRYRL